MKKIANKKDQQQKKQRTLKLSLFGIARTAVLMAALLLFVKSYYVFGGIGIVIYAIILFFERRFKGNFK